MGRVCLPTMAAGGQIALRGGKEGREVEQVEVTPPLMKSRDPRSVASHPFSRRDKGM